MAQLKKLTFEELKDEFEKLVKSIESFVPMGTEERVKKPGVQLKQEFLKKQKTIEEVLEEPDNTKAAVKQEGHTEKENQLKAFLKIVPNEEEEVDYEVLDKRFPIVDWESKFYHTDRHGKPHNYYKVIRSDGSSRWIKTFSEMVIRFDRMDLEELYNLVMQRFTTTT
ncbi:hypothetical protein Tco_0844153 [Tanacetum coccineum]